MPDFTIYNPETNIVYMSGDAPDPQCYMSEYPEGTAIKIGVNTGDPGVFMYDPENECAVRITGAPVLPEAVNKERDRRIASEFRFKDIAFQNDDRSYQKIRDVTLDKIGVNWIATDNSVHTFDAATMKEFWLAARDWRNSQTLAARRIKDMSPIPQDYKNPKYWS